LPNKKKSRWKETSEFKGEITVTLKEISQFIQESCTRQESFTRHPRSLLTARISSNKREKDLGKEKE